MQLEQKDLSRMLETAIVAVRLAGQRAMEEMQYIKISVKNDSELVTQADGRCQQIIIERIKETYPDHGFLGEEGDEHQIYCQPPRGTESIWWVIDPIDGTNNFSHQMPFFAVSIAALYDGWPVVGVVFAPAIDSMFIAVKGREAQLNGRRITCSEKKIDRFASIGLDSNFEGNVPPWACEIIKRTKYRNLGSTALHLSYVANGSMLGTVICHSKMWDIAAGVLISEEAGVIVTDWKGSKIPPFDPANYHNQQFSVIAANKKVHSELSGLINRC